MRCNQIKLLLGLKDMGKMKGDFLLIRKRLLVTISLLLFYLSFFYFFTFLFLLFTLYTFLFSKLSFLCVYCFSFCDCNFLFYLLLHLTKPQISSDWFWCKKINSWSVGNANKKIGSLAFGLSPYIDICGRKNWLF